MGGWGGGGTTFPSMPPEGGLEAKKKWRRGRFRVGGCGAVPAPCVYFRPPRCASGGAEGTRPPRDGAGARPGASSGAAPRAPHEPALRGRRRPRGASRAAGPSHGLAHGVSGAGARRRAAGAPPPFWGASLCLFFWGEHPYLGALPLGTTPFGHPLLGPSFGEAHFWGTAYFGPLFEGHPIWESLWRPPLLGLPLFGTPWGTTPFGAPLIWDPLLGHPPLVLPLYGAPFRGSPIWGPPLGPRSPRTPSGTVWSRAAT